VGSEEELELGEVAKLRKTGTVIPQVLASLPLTLQPTLLLTSHPPPYQAAGEGGPTAPTADSDDDADDVPRRPDDPDATAVLSAWGFPPPASPQRACALELAAEPGVLWDLLPEPLDDGFPDCAAAAAAAAVDAAAGRSDPLRSILAGAQALLSGWPLAGGGRSPVAAGEPLSGGSGRWGDDRWGHDAGAVGAAAAAAGDLRVFIAASGAAEADGTREHAVAVVLPAVAAYARARGVECDLLDLRWGAGAGAWRGGAAAAVYAAELRRCGRWRRTPAGGLGLVLVLGRREAPAGWPRAVARASLEALAARMEPQARQQVRPRSAVGVR
jgi:hypothetical protein